MAVGENFITLSFLPWMHPRLPFFLFFSFLPCLPLFPPLATRGHECLHIPPPTCAFLYFHTAFLLPCIFPIFFCWILLGDNLIALTTLSEIARELEEQGKLDHWRVSVRLPGHMVFPSIWKLEFFCPAVLIHVGVLSIPTPKLGIKVYFGDSFNIFLSGWNYYFWRDEQGGVQNEQISASLGWVCWGHPGGVRREVTFPLLIYIQTSLLMLPSALQTWLVW